MQIEVKKTHIRRGKQSEPEFCPIALAIRESLGTDNVKVDSDIVSIGKKKFGLPQNARDFVALFDFNKSEAEPFVFSL